MTGTVPPVAQGWRIVIADDSPDDRAELRRLLLQGSQRQYEFVEVETASQTLSAVLANSEGPPHCLILDYFLPDADGPGVLAKLRSDDGGLVCAVIVVTGREGGGLGHEGGDLGGRALRAGAQDFIGKAWLSAPSLTRAIENAVTRWEMAREIEANKSRLRRLAQAVPHAVWMTDGAGIVLYVNERWTDYFGAAVHHVHSPIDWVSLMHPDDSREALEQLSRGMRGGQPFQLDCRLRRSDGDYRWHVVNAAPIRDSSSDVTHWYGVNTDVHELRERDARLRLALHAAQTGLWTWEMATDAVTWTPEAYEIMGVAPDAFDGSGSAFFAMVHEEDRARVEDTVKASIRENAPYKAEFRIVRPSGEVIWVQNHGRTSYDASGTPLRMLGSVTDISERKRVDLALKAREREMRMLADNVPFIVARFDRSLRHCFINSAVEKVAARAPAEFLGKTNRELGMPPALCETWDTALQSVFETAQPKQLEFEVLSGAGPSCFSSRLVPEIGADGTVEFVLSVAEDVTQRKLNDAALRAALVDAEEAVRARDRLASLVSHDLKNPLNTLTLAISVLQGAPSPQSHELLAKMARQVRSMDEMIDELLELAQLQAGKAAALEVSDVDLIALARRLIAEHQQTAPRHRLQLSASADSLVGLWDQRRLARVVNNLLSNAIKYSPIGGEIQVDLARAMLGDQPAAQLRVTDSGIGIPPEDMDRVFEWYSRGRNAGEGKFGGHGIGLAGAADIVALHGGTIGVTSVEGKGSTFTVTLPLRRASEVEDK